MTIDSEDLLNSILESLDRIVYIRPDDIPNVDLYMDQVTTFMEKKLKNTARHPGEDKIMTKTMINNYAKNDLLPPPDKKKYSKEHMLMLIFIYYFKGILSINDIQTLLKPITELYFGNEPGFNVETLYKEIVVMEKEQIEDLKKDVIKKYEKSREMFPDASAKEQEFLKKFSFICLLSLDVYVKRLMIEKMVDELGQTEEK